MTRVVVPANELEKWKREHRPRRSAPKPNDVAEAHALLRRFVQAMHKLHRRADYIARKDDEALEYVVAAISEYLIKNGRRGNTLGKAFRVEKRHGGQEKPVSEQDIAEAEEAVILSGLGMTQKEVGIALGWDSDPKSFNTVEVSRLIHSPAGDEAVKRLARYLSKKRPAVDRGTNQSKARRKKPSS